jgi:glucose/arabinose dehydrogenase
MQLRSNDFRDGQPIPPACAFGKPGDPIALSDNRNPHLAWRDAPPGTRSFVLTCIDSDAPSSGDEVPSDELNRVDRVGEHFGYPYCHQGDILDPEFGKGHHCKDYAPPVLKLGAHVASLGLRFYTGKQFPASYHGAIFVAEHGSWNRTKKSGYRVMTVRLNGGKVVSYEPFITGFEQDEQSWGRPVDVQPLPDCSLLVSDDQAGAVYRVTYGR